MKQATPKTKELDVFDVANYFIKCSLDKKIDEGVAEGITNLKLQKILYFAQSAYLALNNKELFPDEIEAWKYGPVISSVYHKYKINVNTVLKLPEGYKDDLNVEVKKFLDGIWELFSKYSTRELVNITHNHKPWSDAYHKAPGTVIEKKVLEDYYKGIFKFQEDGEART